MLYIVCIAHIVCLPWHANSVVGVRIIEVVVYIVFCNVCMRLACVRVSLYVLHTSCLCVCVCRLSSLGDPDLECRQQH